MPDPTLTPEQQAALAEIDADTAKLVAEAKAGWAWPIKAKSEALLARREAVLGDRNRPVLQVGKPDEPLLPDALHPDKLPARTDGQSWSRPKLQAMAEAATDFGVDAEEVSRRLLAAQGTKPPTMEQAEAHLRQAWGGQYDERLAAARLVFNRLPLTLQHELDETGQGKDPDSIRWFSERGKPLLEAQAKIDAIMANKQHAYWRGDPKAVAEMQALYRIVKGTKPVVTI